MGMSFVWRGENTFSLELTCFTFSVLLLQTVCSSPNAKSFWCFRKHHFDTSSGSSNSLKSLFHIYDPFSQIAKAPREVPAHTPMSLLANATIQEGKLYPLHSTVNEVYRKWIVLAKSVITTSTHGFGTSHGDVLYVPIWWSQFLVHKNGVICVMNHDTCDIILLLWLHAVCISLISNNNHETLW